MNLLDCHVPRGYKITYDMKLEGDYTLKKVRKWLAQGYAQGINGNAFDLYKHFADMYGYPHAYVGSKNCRWICGQEKLQRLAPDTIERAKVIERLMPLTNADTHTYTRNRHSDGRWLLDFYGGNGHYQGGNKEGMGRDHEGAAERPVLGRAA